MSKFVDTNTLYQTAKENKAVCSALADLVDIMDIIDHTPPADVAPVIHAKWEHAGDVFYHCTNCMYTITGSDIGNNYCPNCGARMDGAENGTA